MIIFLNENKNIENYSTSTVKQKIDEIDNISNTISDNISKEVKIPNDVLNSFAIKPELNEKIWKDDNLNPTVRTKLIKIANDFFKELNLPKNVKMKDVIFTGSLANYNWSKFSDIDLHIVLDFSEIEGKEEFKDDFFYAQKSLWNQSHDITVYDYPVELYAQDIKDKLVATAVYSVKNDKWILKPKKEEFKINKKAIKQKADRFIARLKDIRKDYEEDNLQSVVDKVKILKDKIKNYRTSGLEDGGEYSIENLVFKTLRRTPFMDILDSYKAKAYDKLMSVSENLELSEIIKKHLNEAVNRLSYDEKPEINVSSYPSLSNPSRITGVNAIKQRIDKAKKISDFFKDEKNTNEKLKNFDTNYFEIPNEGDGYFQVEFRHDGKIISKYTNGSNTDIGTCKSFQNVAKYCFVKAGYNNSAFGKSSADDAANKALIIFKDEILTFYGDDTYIDDKASNIAKEKTSDEWKYKFDKFEKEKQMKANKSEIKADQAKIDDFEKRQAELRAKYAKLKKGG